LSPGTRLAQAFAFRQPRDCAICRSGRPRAGWPRLGKLPLVQLDAADEGAFAASYEVGVAANFNGSHMVASGSAPSSHEQSDRDRACQAYTSLSRA